MFISCNYHLLNAHSVSDTVLNAYMGFSEEPFVMISDMRERRLREVRPCQEVTEAHSSPASLAAELAASPPLSVPFQRLMRGCWMNN